MPYRTCERCGARHLQANSPICAKCRRAGSKKICPVEGCETLVNSNARTCLKHRRLQQDEVFTHCRECGVEFARPSHRRVCDKCRDETRILCACGCGRYRRKYSKDGQIHEYISGHNDNWEGNRRQLQKCAVCGKEFRGASARAKLCSIACRVQWLTINPPNEKKRVLVQCAACGKNIYRAGWQTHPSRSYACSKRCRYIIVANKLSGPKSDAKRLAIQRDGARCKICGFDVLVEVHHITPKHKGGGDALENLITLCPNHHTMADRRMISSGELYGLIGHNDDMAE